MSKETPDGLVMRTEREAEDSTCPMSMTIMPSAKKASFCIGSECMAWVWGGPVVRMKKRVPSHSSTPPKGCDGYEFVPASTDYPAHWLEPEGTAKARRLGFCGMVKR